jgi:purine-binding chemotaxis protein CheW
VENPQSTNDLASSEVRDLMTFRLAEQMYALPIEPVVRIIEMVTITPIPHVGSAVEGVINVQGQPIPVINLRRHFGLSEASLGLRTPIVLVQSGTQAFGLIVDEVTDVFSLFRDDISHVADLLPEGMAESPILSGIAHVEHETVLLLDVEHLLVHKHVQALFQAVAALPESIVGEIPDDEGDVTLDDVQESLPEANTKEAAGNQDSGSVSESLKEDEEGHETG